MIHIETLVFGPFSENTYVLHSDNGDCIIIDPGCYQSEEGNRFLDFLSEKNLNPVKLLNTHCHIDHIFGNKLVYDKFGLKPYIHEDDLPFLTQLENVAKMYGMQAAASPEPEGFLRENQKIPFADTELEVFHTPGHSPGSVIFLERKQGFIISGDVLFYESIGRTDLPGGDYETLLKSIREKVLPLGDHIEVYSGHGPVTTLAHEKSYNPFIQ